MVVFVGDKPSQRNRSKKVPFVGTPSYKRLLDWICQLDLDINKVHTVNRVDRSFALMMNLEDIKIVALGKEAAKAIKEYRDDFFELPHPSGLNRVLHDKQYVKTVLKECHDYLHKRYKRNNLR